MKNLLIVASLSLATLFVAPQAKANVVAQNLCEFVAADAKSDLRRYLKSNRIKIRNVFDTVQCNGKNLLQFAATANATETGTMMIGKLSKKVVSANLASITNTGLKAAANERVNG
ncbi:DUF3718 domain-containing protein [Thalassotalea sediminis]|uniref:DUF3718 domain-containing protein n=1 Tax=Thalassotalea sediminis TaxID=1759089 RepID=UPI0025740846|nr:DUF3718 domain-containing protein [Thalassotalea sediminis]